MPIPYEPKPFSYRWSHQKDAIQRLLCAEYLRRRNEHERQSELHIIYDEYISQPSPTYRMELAALVEPEDAKRMVDAIQVRSVVDQLIINWAILDTKGPNGAA